MSVALAEIFRILQTLTIRTNIYLRGLKFRGSADGILRFVSEFEIWKRPGRMSPRMTYSRDSKFEGTRTGLKLEREGCLCCDAEDHSRRLAVMLQKALAAQRTLANSQFGEDT
ncbi:hypothetical protein C5Y93_09545 [Blastopirellula marina]|uniref:Uncharacterized protein n=1 Tax=Blastopirellula marina TaxID=124 RepID=A0A2S8GP66_9BACT|nr:hypothetical protein C5Y93_09545 [Blastopirellula marina]